MRSLLLSLALAICATSTAAAQDFEAAGKHFSAAQDAFGKKHYKTAATEFEAAYAISKDPVLLYNIGESWQLAGDGKKAAASYKQYLTAQPEAQDKAEVEKRIRGIEAKNYKLVDQSAPDDAAPTMATTPPSQPAPATPQPTAPTMGQTSPATPPPSPSSAPTPESAQTATPTPPPAPAVAPTGAAPGAAPEPAVAPPPAAPEKPPVGILDEGPMTKMRVAAWIGVGSTLALLAAGAILGLAAQSRSDEITRQLSFVDMTNQPNKYDMATDTQLQQLRSDGNLYNGLAIGFFSAAAASAVVTTVLFIVDAKRPKHVMRALRLSPAVDKHAAGLQLGWSF